MQVEGTVVTARRQGAIEIWSSDHPTRSPVQLGVASDVGETNCIINLCDGRVVSVGAAVIMWDVASKSSVAHVQLLDGQGDIYKVFFISLRATHKLPFKPRGAWCAEAAHATLVRLGFFATGHVDGSLRLCRCCGNRVECLDRLDGPVDKSVWTLQSCRSNQAEVAVVAVVSYVGEGEPPEMWLWNLGTGEAVGVHEPDSHFIGMADLSGGCLLACGEGSDEDASTLHVWNVSGPPAAQRELAVAVLDATCSPVCAAVFPADCGAGQSVMVAVGGIAGSLQLWRWDPPDDHHGVGELVQLDGARGGTAVPMPDVDNQPASQPVSRLRARLDGITSIAGAMPARDCSFALSHQVKSRSMPSFAVLPAPSVQRPSKAKIVTGHLSGAIALWEPLESLWEPWEVGSFPALLPHEPRWTRRLLRQPVTIPAVGPDADDLLRQYVHDDLDDVTGIVVCTAAALHSRQSVATRFFLVPATTAKPRAWQS